MLPARGVTLLYPVFCFLNLVLSTPLLRRESIDSVLSLPEGSIDTNNALSSNLSIIASAASAGNIPGSTALAAYDAVINAISPTGTPDSVAAIVSMVSSAYAEATPADIAGAAAKAKLLGIDNSNPPEKRASADVNSCSNSNKRSPSSVYPKSSSDAPFSITETALRSAIYIPDSFQYGTGSKQPIILVPGTAIPAGSTYQHNYAELLAATSFADPLWVNIPGSSLREVHTNAEYVAYAINYIAGITGKNVSVITFSQGSLNTQWALKYWPSTRSVVSDFIAMSPNFHGTKEAYLLCPLLSALGCTPSIFQQTYDSKFIQRLRANGGDSAYVPTTTIYSSTDEIVQPQSGTGASGYILDSRGVGVSNNQVQTICPGKPAGGLVLHEGMIYNSLAWALTVDALTNDGPAKSGRVDLVKVCGLDRTPGLSIVDVLEVETTLNLDAVDNVLSFSPKCRSEPSVPSYAF